MEKHREWIPPRSSTAAWIVYDLANTVFALGVGSLYFAAWLTETESPDVGLAVGRTVATLLLIVLAPWIGARSDHAGRRLPYLTIFTIVAVVMTAGIATVGVVASLLIFVLATIGWNLATVVYEAMLPDVAVPARRGRVSGIGVAVGYLGSAVAVVIGRLVIDPHGYAAGFRAIALAFLLFALPAFLLIRERPRTPRGGRPPGIRDAGANLVATWRRATAYPGVARFFVARFLYADPINTFIGGFLTIYIIEEIGLDLRHVEGVLALAIVAAIAGGLVSGPIVDRFGPRRVLHGAIYGWIVALGAAVVAAVADQPVLIWPIGVLGGVSMAATWTSDRAYLARISPPRYYGQFFGLYAVAGRFLTFLGPLIWLVVIAVGLPRTVALVVLGGFLVAGRIVLAGVDDQERTWSERDRA